MKRKRIIVLIYFLTTLLYLVTTIAKLSFSERIDGGNDDIIAEIESVVTKLPISEKEIAYLKSLSGVKEIKEVRVANIFVENLGIYEFRLTEEEKLVFAETLYELVKHQEYIEVFYGEQEARFATSDIVVGNHQNMIDKDALKTAFNVGIEELPTIMIQVKMDSNVDLNTLESELLKKGLHFRDYSSNKYKLLTIGGMEIIEFLFGAITVLNYIITILISYSLCKENRRNVAILRIHGYGKNEVRMLQLLQYGKIYVIANILLLLTYFLLVFLAEILGGGSFDLHDKRVFNLYLKLLITELLMGMITTVIVCEIYLRTNMLKLIKKGN